MLRRTAAPRGDIHNFQSAVPYIRTLTIYLAPATSLVKPQQGRAQGGIRWPAKWKGFRARSTVGVGQLQLVMLLLKSGMQAALGEISGSVVVGSDGSAAHSAAAAGAAGGVGAAVHNTGKVQTSLHTWLSAGPSSS